jgi:hypothetical protein
VTSSSVHMVHMLWKCCLAGRQLPDIHTPGAATSGPQHHPLRTGVLLSGHGLVPLAQSGCIALQGGWPP